MVIWFAERRSTLSGMRIKGTSGSDSNETLLYEDNGTVNFCPNKTAEQDERESWGSSVCNKYISIWFNVNKEVSSINISMSDQRRQTTFSFYEVQVYAGL